MFPCLLPNHALGCVHDLRTYLFILGGLDMATKRNSEISPADRREIFIETYGNHFDAGWTLVHLVRSCGFFLAKIVGEESALRGMSLVTKDMTEEGGSMADWAEDLDYSGTNAFCEWPLGIKLYDLTAYAEFGVILCDDPDPTERRTYLKSLIQEVKEFYNSSPIEVWGGNSDGGERSELELLITLATNRWELDNERPIDPKALSYFGGITEGSVRNMMSGADATFRNEDGKIPAVEALFWLEKRNEYWNSVWEELESPEVTSQSSEEVTPVFVPVARDGSIFHPGLKRPSGFIIGKKGDESHIDDFDEALTLLQSMPTPYWRRPNDKGVPGIVKGMRWARVDTSLVAQAAASPNFRLPDSI
jgi:hypothetical protein